jgi:uncharacterized DUF497 family protein
MKQIRWNEEKNELLKREREVGFEEVLIAMDNGHLLDVLKHRDLKKYPHQRIFVVNIGQYAYLVPFVETNDELFLKTIIPSRKATKIYLIDKKLIGKKKK